MKKFPEIILATSSPQRSQILEELDLPFKIISKEVEEIVGKTPEVTVEYNARLKAQTVAKGVKAEIFVLAADTVLVRGAVILGKPSNNAEAKSFLASFSGKNILAYTGVVVTHRATDTCLASVETAEIAFRSFSQEMIDWYVSTGEPLTRAGAFGISKRGEILVEAIHGSYSCIAGLPKRSTLLLLNNIFKATGISQTDFYSLPDLNQELCQDIPKIKQF